VPPNANLEIITKNLKNTVRVKTKKLPTVQAPVGAEGMDASDIAENILAVYNAIERVIQRENINSLYVKTTMGEAVRIW